MKKRIFSTLVALVLAFTLVACSTDNAVNNGGNNATGDAAGSEGKTIGFVVSTQTNPFFVSLKNGVEKKAAELGYEVITIDAQDDPAKATAGMEDLITKNVDIIIVNPTDSDAIVTAVESANDADIPVLTVDRMSNGGEVVSHIASDNEAGGQQAGEFIIEQIGEGTKVVELEGVPGANSAIERGKGFEAALEGKDIEVVAKQTANFDRTQGLDVMENILQSQPEIDAVFAQNDEMALGALEAIEASGRDILVVGFDATDDAVKSVEDGKLAATIAQKPELMGETVVEVAAKYLDGETVEDFVPVELELIKK